MGYDLKDRVVLITGASGGIGRACAVEYHRAGARVVATARSLDKLEALAAEIGGDRIAAFPLDVTKPAEREAAVRFVEERFGPVEVLVNNAGWASFSSVACTPPEHIEQMVQLNFVGPIALTQMVLPRMLSRRSGQIVNISSVVGNQTIPRMSIYSATKAALTSLSTGLRMELRGSGVDVINVAPGSTNTDFFDAAGNVNVKAVRFARSQYTPQRVARAVVSSSRRRRREVTLTAEGKTISAIRRVSHRLADLIMYHTAKHAMPPDKS